jgi:enoyl-CoA hydratase/carnithine racemase
MNHPGTPLETHTEKLVATREGAIGWIVFNNPQRHNAVSLDMWEALPRVLRAYEEDPEVRVVVLRGAGEKAFVAGADISQFKEKRSSPEAVEHYNMTADAAGEALRNCTKPTVAMVRGYCIGGGTGIAVSCDVRIAADDARFGVPAAKLGLGYRFAGIKRLADIVGPAFTAEIFYTGRQFNGQEALQMGLVNRLVPAGELEHATRELAATIANNAPLTIASVKRALLEYGKDAEERDLGLCQKMVEDCYASEDYKEGQTAFMEKRKPAFKGR